MEMKEVFERLKQLQEILSQKYDLELQVADTPRKLVSQDELLARLKKEYIEKNEVYERVKSKVVRLKSDLATVELSREKSEKGMDEISTHREYEALDKEIKDAVETEQGLRHELQKEEKHLADLNDNLKQEEELINQQESELNQGKESLALETSQLKEQLALLKEQEDKIIPDLDPEMVYKFERIIRSKHSKGIVAVKGNVCDGCHMILPAQFANDVHNGEEIVFCPYCSRILFYEEADESIADYFHVEETGSLVDLGDDFDEYEEEEEEDEAVPSRTRSEFGDTGFDD
ncbi:MAG: zinc ribbon domain-containing protein [Treponemataceae bacterium]